MPLFFMKTTRERYSNCCGAEASDGYEDSGICTKCNDHCSYEAYCSECDTEITNTEQEENGTCERCDYLLHKV